MIYLPLINKFAYLAIRVKIGCTQHNFFSCKHESYVSVCIILLSLLKREVHLIFNFQLLILKVAEQRRTSRTPEKEKHHSPGGAVTDYGRIQPQAPELEEAVFGSLDD